MWLKTLFGWECLILSLDFRTDVFWNCNVVCLAIYITTRECNSEPTEKQTNKKATKGHQTWLNQNWISSTLFLSFVSVGCSIYCNSCLFVRAPSSAVLLNLGQFRMCGLQILVFHSQHGWTREFWELTFTYPKVDKIEKQWFIVQI